MRIRVCGAAGGEVTGSAYLVQTSAAAVLIDAGLFQGGSAAEALNSQPLPPEIEPARLNAVVLTHAHLDHTGRLPLLFKRGYRGPVFATAPTIELGTIILKDSAKLQVQDSLRVNRKRERAGEPPLEPLYLPEHVEPLADLARTVRLHAAVEVAAGIQVRFFEAGHILGSASLELTVEEGGTRRIVVFSGDLGPTSLPIIREFEPLTRADVVFLESTYGDRDHRDYQATVREFEDLVVEAAAQRGKMLVPTFAIGRAQQILYHLALFFREKRIRPFPVILDSPMAIEATRVYARYPELFDDEMRALRKVGVDPLDPAHFRASVTAEDSKALNELEGPCLILAGSGMCTGGRILHHLKQNLWKSDTRVLIVGFQAAGSLGRQLVDGAQAISIHGERIAVRGRVHTLGGFSAHAGQGDLLKWFATLAPSHPHVVLTHGENAPRRALSQLIQQRFQLQPVLPDLNQMVDL